MKRIANLLAISLVTLFSITSCKDDDDNNMNTAPNDTDKNFMTMGAYGNRNEIDFAQMALTMATDDSVKIFAQTMIDDHGMAMSELDSIANMFSFTLPTTIDSIHGVTKTRLMGLSGHEFDTAYINSQVQDHIDAINLFQNEINSGNNVSIKSFAVKTLPHLQMHKETADRLKARLQ